MNIALQKIKRYKKIIVKKARIPAGLTINKTYLFFNSFFECFAKKFFPEIRDFLILIFQFYNYVENVRFVHNVTDGYFGVERGLKMNKNAIFLSKFKKIVLFLSVICFGFNLHAETINWLVDGETYATTNCESGDDVILPTAPTKKGYTFAGWTGYTPIEYIQSTGTQCIDTGYVYVSNQKARVIVDTTFVANNKDGWKLHGMSPYWFGGPAVGISNDNKITYGVSGRGTTTNVSGELQKRYLFDLDIQHSYFKVVSVDNNQTVVDLITGDGDTRDDRVSFKLFCPDGTSRNISMVYSTKLYDKGILVRDMIPVLDENGIPCMYDRVTKEFFYNSGTGDFIAGPVINQ